MIHGLSLPNSSIPACRPLEKSPFFRGYVTMHGMKTPYYLIDETILDEDADRFLESMKEAWPNAVLSYSVKTNALPWLLAHYRKKGLLAEVVSAEEYELAKKELAAKMIPAAWFRVIRPAFTKLTTIAVQADDD